jgi:hypothetical protein
MSGGTKHLPFGVWILFSLLVVGVVLGVLFYRSGNTTVGNVGRWVRDERGVWIADGEPIEKPAEVRQQEYIIREATLAYSVVKDQGKDLSTGPCLGMIFQDWVADIVHAPREAIDEKTENQCPDYLQGNATHFIELSLEGGVVRIQ